MAQDKIAAQQARQVARQKRLDPASVVRQSEQPRSLAAQQARQVRRQRRLDPGSVVRQSEYPRSLARQRSARGGKR